MSQLAPLGSPENWVDQEGWINATLEQVEKDFRLQGINISLTKGKRDYAILVQEVVEVMRSVDLINHDKFAGLLYQLDLSEKKMISKLHRSSPENIYQTVAHEIIKRCFEKVWWRNHFKSDSNL